MTPPPGGRAGEAGDLSGREHWDRLWRRRRQRDLNRRLPFNRRFISLIRPYLKEGGRVLEVGCAGSQWLPYLCAEHGLEITGIDYSEPGIESLRLHLRRRGLPHRLYCCDFRSAPSDLLGRFDVVYSLGVVEHFEDYAGVIGLFSRFLAPGGSMITVVPNLASPFYSRVQSLLSAGLLGAHVRMDRDMLRRAHGEQLEVLFCDYFGAFQLSLLSFGELRGLGRFLDRFLIGGISAVTDPLVNGLTGITCSGTWSSHIAAVAVRRRDGR